jgi:hypothetical protein
MLLPSLNGICELTQDARETSAVVVRLAGDSARRAGFRVVFGTRLFPGECSLKRWQSDLHRWGEGHLEVACNPVVAAALRMSLDYFPGSAFGYRSEREGSLVPVARLQVDDGRFGLAEDFADIWPDCWPCRLQGSMPVASGRSEFFVNWWEGGFLRTTVVGQWTFGVEYGGDGTEDRADRSCLPHYYSWGTCDARRAVEADQPGTLALRAISLLGIIPTRRPAARYRSTRNG